MGISWDKDPKEWIGGIKEQLIRAAEEGIAERLVEEARQRGLSSVDSIKLDLTVDGDSNGDLPLDEARIQARANELLHEG